MISFRNLVTLLLCAWCLNGPAPLAQTSPEVKLNQVDFVAIQEISAQARQATRSANAVYVGIGRSPGPVIAYLEATGSQTVNLPLSGLSRIEFEISQSRLTGVAAEKALYESLHSHLKAFLGSAFTPGTEVVLIDYSVTGRSYALTWRLMRRYLAEACPTCTLKGVVINGNPLVYTPRQFVNRINGLTSADAKNLKVIELGNTPATARFAKRLHAQEFDPLSEYSSYDASNPRQSRPAKNAGYAQLQEWISKQIAEDGLSQNRKADSLPLTGVKREGCSTSPRQSTAKPVARIAALSGSIVNAAGMTASLLPQFNPFAQVVGLDCEKSRKMRNRIQCAHDSRFNPFNDVIHCTEVLAIWTLPSDSTAKALCGVRIRSYSFRVSSSKGKEFLKSSGLLEDSGIAHPPELTQAELLRWLKARTGTPLIDTDERVFPETIAEMF